MAQKQRGFAFKLMNPKAIVEVLTVIGVHPAVTCENIEKPTSDIVTSMYQALSEYSYDVDTKQVKFLYERMRGCEENADMFDHMPVEIIDEAMDMIVTFKFARHLAFINKVEDFCLKDIWDPQCKRLRAVLSGIINFCRYKETQMGFIQSLKDEVQDLDSHRVELVDKLNGVYDTLAQAQEQHNSELQDMWEAEEAERNAADMVRKLQKQRQASDRLLEQASTKAEGAKENLAQTEQRAEQLREHITALQEQVADSPEGLQREIEELNHAIRTQKAKVEDRSNHKRSRTQRVQVLKGLKSNIETFKQLLDRVGETAAARSIACDRTCGAQNELAGMSASLESRRGEELDLKQSIEQMSTDMEAAKQSHEEQVQRCDALHEQALAHHQELQAKRNDEQRQFDLLMADRMQLENQIASMKRAYEAEMGDFEAKLGQIEAQGQEYTKVVEGLLTNYNAEVGRPVAKAAYATSPCPARTHRRTSHMDGSFACSPGLRVSPSPRRLYCQ
jgi:hypothetical protein